jgi:FKBP-type peptidyl-prolyl cis-trans isomerase 2
LRSQLVPGSYVRLPDRPDWGIGQVQTVIGTRVTVNFEHAGKRLINTAVVALMEADPDCEERPLP